MAQVASPLRVDFDHGPLPGGTSFVSPHRIIRADTPATISTAFAALQDAMAQGFWLAGYTSYELGYALSATLAPLLPAARGLPLLHFGVFDAPQAAQANDHGPASLAAPIPLWNQSRYDTAFAQIAEFIAAGDIYQANLTFPLQSRYTGSPAAVFAHLRARQPAPHGAYVDLGGPVLLSRSPELFFSIDAKGVIVARPMKGTAARGATAQADADQIAWLQTSAKNQAENLMIVDLMRNDIGRLAEIGSVRVPDLFTVETYATLHQMTSRITAQLRPHLTVQEIFTALFPCGSITGAPKIRAMEIIHMLEGTPRDAYCGAIGWIAPDQSMQFNVAIRTLTCHPDGSARMNVGGGIVHDSDPAEEYAEALLKARFAQLNVG